MKRRPSGPRSPAAGVSGAAVKSRLLTYWTKLGVAGFYIINDHAADTFQPDKSVRFPQNSPTTTPSGSGPLSSLRLSKVLLEFEALKFAGNASAVIRSKASPESKVNLPLRPRC